LRFKTFLFSTLLFFSGPLWSEMLPTSFHLEEIFSGHLIRAGQKFEYRIRTFAPAESQTVLNFPENYDPSPFELVSKRTRSAAFFLSNASWNEFETILTLSAKKSGWIPVKAPDIEVVDNTGRPPAKLPLLSGRVLVYPNKALSLAVGLLGMTLVILLAYYRRKQRT
ncbi:MAG: hypothetical protein JNM63_08105, partial [Spirochaetia bacterium]|nr:hypothetical protein [Spirochaetia bacterium]